MAEHDDGAVAVVSTAATPFEFYRKIGNPKYFVAPMVEHSELAYRMMCRAYGSPVVFTQMLHSRSFSESAEFRQKSFITHALDRPLIVQFNGDDPDVILAAAKYVEDQCDAVDINLGCPQGIAKRGHYGAFLMEELELLTNIVRTVSQGLKVPVTCKTRIYKDFDRSVRLCETLAQAGASMLTIHGRTREERGQLVAEVDWDMVRRLKEHFGDRIPIVANGGIQDLEDVHRCLGITGCNGVMSSEGVLENPTIFSGGINSEGRKLTQLDIAEEYLSYCRKYPEPTILKKIRGHMMKFLYRYFTVHTEVRNMMGAAQTIEEHEDVCRVSVYAKHLCFA
jgi:tRNA-dihydrouridine synthase 1